MVLYFYRLPPPEVVELAPVSSPPHFFWKVIMTEQMPQLVDDAHTLATAVLVHRVLRPQGDGPFPTVVMIHGRAGNEDVMWIFRRTLPQNWLVVAPRAIKPDPDGGYSWHPRQPGEWPSLSSFGEAVTAVFQFLHALPILYNADPNQIYLMGFSQGAATAIATALQHPTLVQGIASLVGFIPPHHQTAIAHRPLHNMPVFMAVGKKDPLIPLHISRTSATALRQAGANLFYQEYDTGHKLNVAGMRDLTAWWQARAQALTL
ncbi:MAG: hypothetical protein D6706_06575 [Chloroflexi bacterium]|nr:MAG: hypothetical protein D6706_06575 [Chloroflexota bacterium]